MKLLTLSRFSFSCVRHGFGTDWLQSFNKSVNTWFGFSVWSCKKAQKTSRNKSEQTFVQCRIGRRRQRDGRFHCCLTERRSYIQITGHPGASLCGVCMFSLRLCGFSEDTPAFLHRRKMQMHVGLEWLSVSVCRACSSMATSPGSTMALILWMDGIIWMGERNWKEGVVLEFFFF